MTDLLGGVTIRRLRCDRAVARAIEISIRGVALDSICAIANERARYQSIQQATKMELRAPTAERKYFMCVGKRM